MSHLLRIILLRVLPTDAALGQIDGDTSRIAPTRIAEATSTGILHLDDAPVRNDHSCLGIDNLALDPNDARGALFRTGEASCGQLCPGRHERRLDRKAGVVAKADE